MQARDGFQLLVTHERDESGRYKGTRIDVRHLASGDTTAFWSEQCEGLSPRDAVKGACVQSATELLRGVSS